MSKTKTLEDFITIVRGTRTVNRNIQGINLRAEFHMATDGKNMSAEIFVNDNLALKSTPIVDSQDNQSIFLAQQVGESAVYIIVEGNLHNGQSAEARIFARVGKGIVNETNPCFTGLEDYMPKLAERHPEWFRIENKPKVNFD